MHSLKFVCSMRIIKITIVFTVEKNLSKYLSILGYESTYQTVLFASSFFPSIFSLSARVFSSGKLLKLTPSNKFFIAVYKCDFNMHTQNSMKYANGIERERAKNTKGGGGGGETSTWKTSLKTRVQITQNAFNF